MGDSQNFFEELEAAAAAKTEYVNTKLLPEMIINYQFLHTCVKNIYDVLIRRSLINADPYKFERKISDIILPDESPFPENERAEVMGLRLSDYESMLDFICTYYKFSIDNLDLAHIKQLMDFNACIDWANFSTNSGKINTRMLAMLLNEARMRAEAVLFSLINDSIDKGAKAVTSINAGLKELLDLQRERYKIEVRKKIIQSPSFNKDALASPEEELAEVRRLFPELIGKEHFYGDLIQEIVKEDASLPDSQLRTLALQRLSIKEHRHEKKKQKVDTRRMLIDTALVLSALAPQYEQVVEKVRANHDVLEKERITIFGKIIRAIRRLFNLEAPSEKYILVIINQRTGVRSTRIIEYNEFVSLLVCKRQLLQSVGTAQMPEYQKLVAASDEAVLNFINLQISDNQEIIVQLDALDEYFKTQGVKINQSKIKGIKMELVVMKNTIIRANQKRAEYISVVEEEAQLKKLGISNED